MRLGNLSFFVIFLILVLSKQTQAFSQEKINLENIQPSFEEELDNNVNNEQDERPLKLKTKVKKNIKSNQVIVKFRALDKITAKTSDLSIIVGKKKRFGYLEIFPRKCRKADKDREVVVYVQVKDLSDKKDDKVFVFNGWTFSSSPTIRAFDHPIYDLWVTGCENV